MLFGPLPKHHRLQTLPAQAGGRWSGAPCVACPEPQGRVLRRKAAKPQSPDSLQSQAEGVLQDVHANGAPTGLCAPGILHVTQSHDPLQNH